MTGEANKTLKTKNNTSIRSKHQKGLPNSATSGAGMTLRNPVRETFFVVGELNHTFALKPAHTKKPWATPPSPKRRQLVRERGWRFLPKAFAAFSPDPSRENAAGERLRTLVLPGSVFPQVTPQTNASRTLRTVCERSDQANVGGWQHSSPFCLLLQGWAVLGHRRPVRLPVVCFRCCGFLLSPVLWSVL